MHNVWLDALADVSFWGRDEFERAAELGAARTNEPGDIVSGWLNLPVAEAYGSIRLVLSVRQSTSCERDAST